MTGWSDLEYPTYGAHCASFTVVSSVAELCIFFAAAAALGTAFCISVDSFISLLHLRVLIGCSTAGSGKSHLCRVGK